MSNTASKSRIGFEPRFEDKAYKNPSEMRGIRRLLYVYTAAAVVLTAPAATIGIGFVYGAILGCVWTFAALFWWAYGQDRRAAREYAAMLEKTGTALMLGVAKYRVADAVKVMDRIGPKGRQSPEYVAATARAYAWDYVAFEAERVSSVGHLASSILHEIAVQKGFKPDPADAYLIRLQSLVIETLEDAYALIEEGTARAAA